MGAVAVLEGGGGLPDFITQPMNRKERKARKVRLKKEGRSGRDDFLERVVKDNITSTIGLSTREKEKLLRLQKATDIPEEQRLKLDALEGLRIEHGELHRPRAHNVCQVPIEYYHKRGWLTARQLDAGIKFHELWYYGAVKIGLAQMKLTSLPGGRPNPDFLRVAADRYQKAKAAIRGLPQALVCYNVCCIGEWASKLWPKKVFFEEGQEITADDLRPFYKDRDQKMEWLKQGLEDLAGHFRIPENKSLPQSKENA